MSTTFSNPAYDYIRQELMAGNLTPGMRLSEFGIAKKLGSSRSPVREAISQLISEGLLQKLPGYGAYVKIPTRREIQELTVVRELLECHTVAQAAERADDSQIEQLMENCRQMHAVALTSRESGMTDELLCEMVELDMRFHTMIYEIADNLEIKKIMESSRILAGIFFSYQKSFFTPGRVAKIWREHTRLVQAIKNRQPVLAQDWLRKQIRNSKEIYTASLEELMLNPRLRELKTLTEASVE